MTKETRSRVSRARLLLASLLLAVLPLSGVGNLATAAYAIEADQDTSLSTFTVDGTTVTDGGMVDIAFGSTSVDVVAIPTNPDATVSISGETALETGDNLVQVLVTAADSETTQTYSVTVDVHSNGDKSLGVFAVNGEDVFDGSELVFPYGTTEVEVVAEPTDVEAVVSVVGGSDLVSGDNQLVVTVTAEDGSELSYTVVLRVAANSDASLAVFAVDGVDVVDGSVVLLPYGTLEVDVVAEASDVEAGVSVVGGSDLGPGDNQLVVTVTAEDGSELSYTVVLRVAANSDASLAVFAVDGVDVVDGSVVLLPYGTLEVDVVAEASDVEAGVSVVGGSDLVSGDNQLVVTVTAEDGSELSYTVVLRVAANSDASLAVFAVDGVDVVDGSVVLLPYGTLEVDVVAEASDVEAGVSVVGGSDLGPGDNQLVVTVTAEDGSELSYTVVLRVAANSDASLAVFAVDGVDVVDGSVVLLPYGTLEVDVVAEASDAEAVVEVSGGSVLVSGDNQLVVTVTAEDGSELSYTVVLRVAANSDASLAVFAVDGVDVVDGSVVLLPYGTLEVDVVAEASDAEAVVEVSGGSVLVSGDNQLVVTVTAEDGSELSYTVVLRVAANSDASLAVFAVDGVDVVDGSVVLLPYGTLEVDVVAEASDVEAGVSVVGGSDLGPGDNQLVVTVTAEDGSELSYTVVLRVAANSDTSLAVFSVAGQDVVDGSVVLLPYGTLEVDVVAEASDVEAGVSVVGGSDLVSGDNQLVVTVTAEDGSELSYTVVLRVAANSDASLAVFAVDGVDVVDGSVVLLPYGTLEVDVVAEASDVEAGVSVVGGSDLGPGDNQLVVTVTAEDGSELSYTVVLRVAANSDASLAVFAVDGVDVVDGSVVLLPYGTLEVDVVAEASDVEAGVSVVGGSDLVSGDNQLVVTVTAEDGSELSYTVVLRVAANSDASLAVFSVAGQDVVDGSVVTVGRGVGSVVVEAEATDLGALVVVAGASGLSVGVNEVSVTVTAADGSVRVYRVSVVVPPVLSSDTSLAVFTVDAKPVVDGSVVLLPYGTLEVDVVAEATDAEAVVEVSGGSVLVSGDNQLVVTVTAEDGTELSYTVVLRVAANSDASLAVFAVDGVDVVDGSVVLLPYGTLEVDVVAEASDVEAGVSVVGGSDLGPGDNQLVVTVTAEDGSELSYTVVLRVAANSDASLAVFAVDGVDVVDGSVVLLPYGTLEVDVVAEATDAEAVVEVSGGSVLVSGDNQLVVTVTAEDGTELSYTVVLRVAANSDTSLAVFSVAGQDVVDGSVVTVGRGVGSVVVEAEATDLGALVVVAGASGLSVGVNEVSVTVTAADGSVRVYRVSVVVPPVLSSDTSLAVFTVDAKPVVDGSVVLLPYGTLEVDVVAEATDAEAVVEVSGGSVLVSGDNQLVVTVTAEDGSELSYTVVLRVAANSDTSLAVFSVAGQDVVDGSVVTVGRGVGSVVVEAEATDLGALVVVAGASGLSVGVNEVSVTVTAADGSVRVYRVSVVVPPVLSSDTSLAVFTVDAKPVVDGSVVLLPYGTLEVDVVAEATDAEAVVEVSGGSVLVSGDNQLVVTVTAEDGSELSYTVVLRVAANSDTSLAVFSVAGQDVVDGSVVTVGRGVGSVVVEAEATDLGALVVVAGASGLSVGVNEVSVTVTAADGSVRVYRVSVVVPPVLSSDTSLAVFSVAGQDVVDGSVVTVGRGVGSVVVEAEATDLGALVVVAGASGLSVGVNEVSVTVTAADGSVRVYRVSVVVPPVLSSDTSLAVFSVAGQDVVDGSVVTVGRGVGSVVVEAEATDLGALVVVAGASGLSVGVNEVSVTVTAADGSVRVYRVSVVVPPVLSSDTSLAVFSVAGQDVVDGSVVTVGRGVGSVVVEAEATDLGALVVVAGASGLSVGVNEVSVTVTAADGSVRVYRVSVVVPPVLSSDTSLAVFSVAGQDVVDGSVVTVGRGVGSVVVEAEATDLGALVVVAGASGLSVGVNEVSVTVTAADGSVRVYRVSVVVPPVLSSDTSLAVFSVAGQDVVDGSVVTVGRGVGSVVVEAEATDLGALVVVAGASGLSVGVNEVSVTVTAADGSVRVYRVSVVVPPVLSSDTSLAVFSVAGQDVVDGSVVTVGRGVGSVVVEAEATDLGALVVVAGASGLSVGVNEVSVTVTAADGSVRVYRVSVVVPPVLSSDTSLAVFSVAGQDVVDGSVVTVGRGVGSVVVEAEATDLGALVVVAGASGLSVGVNEVSVTVTAADGSVRVYRVSVVVPPVLSSDTSLAVFSVAGQDVVDGSVVTVGRGVGSVVVEAEATDLGALVVVAGASGLSVGVNEVSVTVTAADGSVRVYRVSVVVPPVLSSDTSLAVFSVAGQDVVDGSVVTVGRGVGSVVVEAEATDLGALVVVAGASGLSVGVNEVSVTVTAADGSVRVYRVSVVVPPVLSSDTSLAVFSVAGQDVVDGSVVTVGRGVGSVVVEAEATDLGALVVVAGASGLSVGVNEVSVTVTAADGSVRVYRVSVVVPPVLSSDTSLAVFSVAGQDVVDGSVVTVGRGVGSVVVEAEATDLGALVVVAGASGLSVGVNEVSVTVTAADGSVRVYRVSVVVPPVLSSDTSLAVFSVAGQDVVDGSVVTVGRGVGSVVVEAEATDLGALVVVAGASGLSVGVNEVSVTVTAADGSVRVYRVSVVVPPVLSSDTSLAVFSVAGQDVVDGSVVTVGRGVGSVVVEAEATDLGALVVVAGASGLSVGVNEVSVTVTAADGSVRVYRVSVVVPPVLSSDTSLAVFSVAGQDVVDGSVVTVGRGVGSVVVEAEATDLGALVVVAGASGLSVGVNEVSVTVTAADGSVRVYRVSVVVPPVLSSDTSLAVFSVAGQDVVDGSVVTVGRGVGSVVVEAEATDLGALVVVAGASGLSVGVNEVSVTVTAADGSVRVYRVSVVVPPVLSSDTSLAVFSVAGQDVVDGSVVTVGRGVGSVVVEAEATDLGALVVVAGASGLSVGVNEVSVTVTAADGSVRVYRVSVVVPPVLSSDTSLAVFSVAGQDVVDGSVVTVGRGVGSVVVEAEATDLGALVVVAGASGLSVGVNEVSVTVTAADGSVRVYRVSVVVPPVLSSDTSLAVFSVAGQDVVDGSVVTVGRGVGSVVVEAEATDLGALVVVAGASGLSVGVNEVSVTVTAADGSVRVYRVSVVVPPVLSSDTSLAVFSVAGQDVVDGSVVTVGRGVGSVVVEAEATDLGALVVVAGASGLSVGVNEVSVTVTAADGSVRVYRVSVVVPPVLSSDTSLAVFSVAGQDVVDGSVVTVGRGVGSVVVEAEATDLGALVVVAGASGLSVGVNEVSVTVTAADGSVRVYRVSVVVPPVLSSDTSLAVFSVAGQDVVDGSVVTVGRGVGSVVVEAEATDLGALVVVAGASGLSVGVNEVSVTVTAADGSVRVYRVSVVVPPVLSSDTSLASLSVDGTAVLVNSVTSKPYGTSSVAVSAVSSSSKATVSVSGNSGLVTGLNLVSVTVTAENGDQAVYRFTIVVERNTDTSVAAITVNGTDVTSSLEFTTAIGATSVSIGVVTTDSEATFLITGNSLRSGINEVLVTVTAANGTSKATYRINVTVPLPAADTSLTSLTVNGAEVAEGATVQLPARTTSVNVAAVTTDPAATVRITGRTGLAVGSNSIQVAVTAWDGKTVRYIYINAVVAPLSGNTDLAEFSVNGTNVSDNGSLELAPLTRSVTVVARPADSEATVVIAGKSVIDGSNTLTATVTAANGTTRTYTVTLVVRTLSADSSLAGVTIDGNAISGSSYTTAPLTTSVSVVALANSAKAIVSVTGTTGLRVGPNTVSVLITAENGTSTLYQYTVTVPASNNAGLKSLAVNGVDVAVASRVTLPRGTKSVLLKAVASDVEAKVSVAGGLNLVAGDNSVVVTITAPDGVTVATYGLTLYVTPPSSDKSLKSFKINGLTVVDAGTVTVPALTTSVNVEASTNDPEASVVVAGRTGLLEGANTVTVTVTAADLSTRTYTVTVRVLSLSSDNSLKSLKVNGLDYTTGTINVAFGTQTVEVVAVPNDESAISAVFGNTGLRTGSNQITVRTTAANGAQAERLITVVVAKSNNTQLSSLTVNGLTVVDGSVTLPVRSSLALVRAITVDPETTVAISGTSLVEGNNSIQLVITAPDGTVRNETISAFVTPVSSNTNLSTLKINDTAVQDGATVNVPNRTSSVAVTAVPVDAEALAAVSGATGLRTGSNIVSITVTAANGTKKTYQVTVIVAKSSNTDLSSLTLNGIDALAGGTITLPARSALATVKAVTSDPESVVATTGTALVEGNNTVVVAVTAPDGTVRNVNIAVYVTPLSSNANLTSFKINGQSVISGSTITLPNRTSSVSVTALTADSDAIAVITGDTALRTGNNTLSVTVTAPSGAKKIYTATLNVLKSSNTALTSLTLNGVDAISGNVVSQAPRTSFAVVKAVTADPDATVIVSQTTLADGDNTVLVTVKAQDGTTRTIQIPVFVTPLSSNTNLSEFSINGVYVVDGSTVALPNKTATVQVIPADSEAIVSVVGNTGLKTGPNTITVTVIAANGSKRTYTVTLVVLKSNNTALNSLTVNGSAVVAGATVTLAPRTVSAVVKAVTADPEATVSVSGASGLVSGANTASVTVTAADGSTRRVEFTLYVTPLSSDNTLKSLTVNGSAYVADSTVELPLGTASVAVVAVANDASASVEITGNTALTGGLNTVSVKVTAANGDVRTYTAKVNVPVRSSNANISTVAGTWTINGVDVAGLASDAVAVELPAGTNAITATAKTEHPRATMAISGATALLPGLNTVTFTVTAENGTTIQTYTRTVKVKERSSNTRLTSLTVGGELVVDKGTVTLPAGSNRVSVIPVLESEEARFTVIGNTGLIEGTNVLQVVVTAPSGATSTTTVNVVVLGQPSDTGLSVFTVNGVAVTDGSTINLAAGTTRIHLSAVANDPQASVSVSGKSGLVAGANTLIVTVTALSGATATHTITLMVGN